MYPVQQEVLGNRQTVGAHELVAVESPLQCRNWLSKDILKISYEQAHPYCKDRHVLVRVVTPQEPQVSLQAEAVVHSPQIPSDGQQVTPHVLTLSGSANAVV